LSELIYKIKEKFFNTRINIVFVIFAVFFCILILRLFVLQIVRGQKYLSNYNLLVEKKESIDATRGNIYDRNGKLLAYNEMAYSVTIADTFSNYTRDQKNAALNKEIYDVVYNAERLGDTVSNDFSINYVSDGNYEFNVTGKTLQRFRADIFGKSNISDLGYDEKIGINTSNASAKTIIEYLSSKNKYNISKKYSEKYRYEILTIRYAMSLNSYRKYISTPITSNVGNATVAYVKENSNNLPGVAVEEKTIRKYNDSKYFSHILGYTGKISTEEYDELSKKNKGTTSNDIVGKAGIEQVMNDFLTGKKGSDTLYVDNMGNVIKQTKHVNAVPGNDVYLSIDKDLQERTYNLLESEVAGILVSNMANIKTFVKTGDEDIVVPVYDAYINLIQNQVIDTSHFEDKNATDLEKKVLEEFNSKFIEVQSSLNDKFSGGDNVAFGNETDEYKEYETFIIKYLKNENVINSAAIDTSDEKFKGWSNGTISINEYLEYCIKKDWIDVSKISADSKYANTSELYKNLYEYVINNIKTNNDFQKIVYKYAILNDMITGNQVCALLYDQNVLQPDAATRDALVNGKTPAYNFMIQKITSLEITPGQLGLTPCSASCVITNAKTGELLACVSYPGYDNNKLANTVDSKYYSYLNANKSSPLYNHATQQQTAPGSTFKMVTATAGLTEGVIDTSTTFICNGQFDLISNKPKCWIYPGSHGKEVLTTAIRDSCNVFFYNVGYLLAGGASNYNDGLGIQRISKYASMYGLTDKTGIEITENKSDVATEYPVMAAIGQSNNNMTTIALDRYVTAVANKGTVYNYTLLNHVQDKKGKVIKTYSPSVKNQIQVLNYAQWSAIHSGMEMVVSNLAPFDNSPVPVAGKTGTAQENKNRPSHALFVGFCPANDPDIAIAVRIPNGYKSAYAASVSRDIIGCYYNEESSIQKANAVQALSITSSSSGD